MKTNFPTINEIIKDKLLEIEQQKFKPNQVPGDKWVGSSKKWTTTAEETFLRSTGAGKFNVGSNSAGMNDYPIYVLNIKKETFWFYHNREALSLSGAEPGRTLGYNVKDDILTLWSDVSGSGMKSLGTLKIVGGQLKFDYTKKNKEAIKNKKLETDGMGVKDIIRTVIDWLGIVPVIGDAADLVNAIWYFYDYSNSNDWEDLLLGVLSLIGIIPIVGSAFTIIGKNGLKLFKRVGNIGEAFASIISTVTKKINPTPAQMEEIANGYSKVASEFSKNGNKIADTLSNYGIDLHKIIDEVDAVFKSGDGVLDDLTKSAQKAADSSAGKLAPKAVVDASKTAEKTSDLLLKSKVNSLVRKWTSLTYKKSASEAAGIISKLQKAIGVTKIKDLIIGMAKVGMNPKRVNALIDTMKTTFKRGIADDPDKFITILKSTNTAVADVFYSKLNTIWKNHTDVILRDVRATGNWSSAGSTRLRSSFSYVQTPVFQAGNPKVMNTIKYVNDLTDSELLHAVNSGWTFHTPDITTYRKSANLSKLVKQIEHTKEYKQLTTKVTNHAIEHGNPMWNSMLADPATKMKALFPKTSYDFFSQMAAAASDVRKWLDVFYHEGHTFLQDLGIADEEDKQALVYPTIKNAIAEHFPNAYNASKVTTSSMVGNSVDLVKSAETSDDPYVLKGQAEN